MNTYSLFSTNFLDNEIYLNSFAQGKYYDENQAQTLLAIARLTPYIGGDAVYSARVMLGFNPNDENLPYIAHPNDSSEIVLENANNNFNIYPNPTTNNFFIESDEVLEINTKFVLYDISAREIMSIDLIKGENKFKINTENLKAGIYFYQIGDKAEDKGKIIILE